MAYESGRHRDIDIQEIRGRRAAILLSQLTIGTRQVRLEVMLNRARLVSKGDGCLPCHPVLQLAIYGASIVYFSAPNWPIDALEPSFRALYRQVTCCAAILGRHVAIIRLRLIFYHDQCQNVALAQCRLHDASTWGLPVSFGSDQC